MRHLELLKDITEELLESWASLYSAEQIGRDPNKVKLLVAIRDELIAGDMSPSPEMEEFYFKVFLREQFSNKNKNDGTG